ncbi:MAG: tetratricopeptide repeat protein [Parvibaculum sp.]|nr:tetratricopeptide repeat protein [Parvibaculum sp.]
MNWWKRGAIGLVLFVVLAFAAIIAYGLLGDGPRAERAMRKGSYAEAVHFYDKALSHSYLPTRMRAGVTAKRAIAQGWLGHYDAALAGFNDSLRLNPDDALAYSARGTLYGLRLEWTQAFKDVDKALSLSPGNVMILKQRAMMYRANLDLEHAVAAAKTLREADPQDTEAYYLEADGLTRMGKTDKALTVIASIPIKSGQEAEIYADRGHTFAALGAYDLAARDIEQALRLAPERAETYWKRSGYFSRQGQYELMFKDLDHSIELDPKNSRVWYSRGREYYQAGDYRAAHNDLMQSVKLDPALLYQFLWLHLADVRLNEDDRGALSRILASDKNKDWPRPVLEFFAGQRDEVSLRANAADKVAPAFALNHLCEATYYAGALYLAKGQREKALPLLHEAAEKCVWGGIEQFSAERDLKSLRK